MINTNPLEVFFSFSSVKQETTIYCIVKQIDNPLLPTKLTIMGDSVIDSLVQTPYTIPVTKFQIKKKKIS